MTMEPGDHDRLVCTAHSWSQADHAHQLSPVGVEVSDTSERPTGVALTRGTTLLTCPNTEMVTCQWPA